MSIVRLTRGQNRAEKSIKNKGLRTWRDESYITDEPLLITQADNRKEILFVRFIAITNRLKMERTGRTIILKK